MIALPEPITDPVLAARKAKPRREDAAITAITYFAAVQSGHMTRDLIVPEISTTVGLFDIKWKYGLDKARKKIAEFKARVAAIDPELEAEDPVFQAALVLLASTEFGQDPRALEVITDYPLPFIHEVRRGARLNGIWVRGGRNRYASVDGSDWNDGINLLTDACAALGRIRRRPR